MCLFWRPRKASAGSEVTSERPVTQTAMITLYDIPSANPTNAWSCNCWKARYSLNYKGIPYKTEWVEYPDIEALAIKLGIPPTDKKPDGTPFYTLPAIVDSSTGAAVSDSILIAQYLDSAYPDTPKLFPGNTEAFQFLFVEVFMPKVFPMWQFIVPVVYTKLNPPSQPYFKFTREFLFGKKLEEVIPTGETAVAEWKKYEDGLGAIDGWLKKNGGKGPFMLGETLSFADIVIGSYIVWWKFIFGQDSKEWKDISSWHDGRWAKLTEALKKYEVVVV